MTISSNQAKEELTLNFKVVDNIISDKHVKNFNKNDYNFKKVPSSLTNNIEYDLLRLLIKTELFLIVVVYKNRVKFLVKTIEM